MPELKTNDQLPTPSLGYMMPMDYLTTEQSASQGPGLDLGQRFDNQPPITSLGSQDHAGLGLNNADPEGASESNALNTTPQESTLDKIFRILRAGGTQPGQLSVEEQMRQHQEEMGLRRQQAAIQLKQLQEQTRQHNWGVAEKLISTGNMEALQEFSKQFPDVLPIVQGVSKQHLSALPTLANEGYLPEEFVQRVMNPGNNPVSPGELATHVKLAMDNWQADIKENAKTKQLAVALKTPEKERKPYQQLMVNEHQKKLDVQSAEIDLKKAQTAKAKQEVAAGVPDHSEDNRIHQAMTGMPWSKGTQQTQRAALELKAKLYPQGKQAVTEEIPVGQTGKAQEYRDPVTGQAAPSWATPKQLSELGFVNIEPSQIAAVNGIRNVDAAMKEILAAGSSLIRRDSGGGNLMEIPRGLAQIPVVTLIKKYSGSPDAQILDSAIKRISPTLAKLSGDTGNIALGEQQLYASSIFNDSDTLESFQAKIRSIEQWQTRMRQSLGFIPDEKAYLRRLVIQGKTDEQIKAIMAERKRYQ